MVESWAKLGESFERVASHVSVKSALNPVIWFAIVIPFIFLPAAYLFQNQQILMWVLAVVAILPVLVTMGGFIYFAYKMPERLQSEDYQIRSSVLKLAQASGVTIPIDQKTVNAMMNPLINTLEDGQK